jgi:hypothetical protein
MTDEFDKEVEAIKTILSALKPLNTKARDTVLDYVFKRLEISPPTTTLETFPEEPTTIPSVKPPETEPKRKIHIEEFKKEKQPRSAIEMTVLTAYYLSNLAPKSERKELITKKDLETYFKIAKYRLPKELAFTLVNAKKAGYLDSAGKGKYKLNPIGYNLVAHSMPKEKE